MLQIKLNEVDNRNRAFLLQELISTDPIISKFPTHQTVDAYQQLLRIAPELSNEKEITRAFLRQAGASQAIDPFQAEQLISANNNLFKQHQMQRGSGSPDSLVKMAVDQIVDHIKQGDSPHDATVKVAREMGLNHNFIKRSCEASNVALHHSHFSKNPTNKAAEFETVDAQKVAEEIYTKA